jgi:decaprenylphospho-beta-D-erythro-pentofuranosid-2-ulose 2-reductase
MARVVIFGANSAMAAAAAREWIARGDSLFLIGRNPQKLRATVEDLEVRKAPDQIGASALADLTDRARHADLIREVRETLGGLDVALIAHGSLPDQKACQGSVDAMLAEMDANALSVISLLTLLANLFEAERKGAIAVIGSVAGDRGRQSNYVYGAAKGMVAIYCQGLRNRLFRSGVTVTLIKPGLVDTPMTAKFEKNGPLWAEPRAIGKIIVRAVTRGDGEVYAPGFWRWIMLAVRNIPEWLFKRMRM